MPVYSYGGLFPSLAEDCFVAPGASVVGDVHIGRQSSVWFGSVVRGDVFHIRIGDRVNIQDNSVVHVTTDLHATLIGDDVTIGHRVILHGCTVHDRALIGMGAIVMDRAIVGRESLVAAGSIVTEGTKIPDGVLAVGSPARVLRELTDEERARLAHSGAHYAKVAAKYLERLGNGQTRVA